MTRPYVHIAARIAAALAWLLVAILALLVAVVSWQVVSRYLLGAPDPYTEELARFLLIWLGLLGSAYAVHVRAHLGLSLLADRLSGRMARLMTAAVRGVLVIFALGGLVGGGGGLVALTWQLHQSSAALGAPMAFVYAVIPLSGLLIALFAVTAETGDMAGHGEEEWT